jgi:ATP-binding cassette subfamily C protein CydC
VGSIGLLVDAARRPAWLAIAVALTALEIVAFLRSPLQFFERLATHRVGFAAVERWRAWLLEKSTRWSFSRWRRYSTGDLLQRFLSDTDTLQDLWLRAGIPLLATALSVVVADLVVALLSPTGAWVLVGVGFALVHLGTLALALLLLPGWQSRERRVREAGGAGAALGVSLRRAAPELLALGASSELAGALTPRLGALASASRDVERHQRRVSLLVAALPLLALVVLLLVSPRGSGLEYAVSLGVALALFGELAGVPGALQSVVAVGGVAERLEELASEAPRGSTSLGALDLGALDLEANLRVAVGDDRIAVALHLGAGRRLAVVGSSGSGKSRLLLALAGLDDYEGSVTLGGVELREVHEEELRSRLAYLPAEPTLLEGFVRDVVGLSRGVNEVDLERLRALGVAVGPNDRLSGLSRGERARVALVRALHGSPEIVILDEPTSALGTAETLRVLELLGSLSCTLVVATHDERVREFCGQVLDLETAPRGPESATGARSRPRDPSAEESH